MTSSVTKVTSGSLEQAAQTLAGHVESYSSLKSSLQSLLESSSSSFQGQAASAFQSAGSDWTSATSKTKEALEEIYEKLKKAAGKYTATDQDEAGKQKGTDKGTGDDKGTGTDKGTDKGSGTNAADLAEQYKGKSSHDLKQSSDLPMNKNQTDDTVDCANFVSATLQKSGQINWHEDSVDGLASHLKSDGWVATTTPSKGDVAIMGSGSVAHTELVHSNNNGSITLIGSNNSRADGTQEVGLDSYSATNPTGGTITYYHKK